AWFGRHFFFGAVSRQINKRDLYTFHDMKSACEAVDRTKAYLVWPFYRMVDALNDKSKGGVPVKYISNVHYFLLYRDDCNDIRMNTEGFLRFAEPLSHRLQLFARDIRMLTPLTSDERERGTHIFVPGPIGRKARAEFAAKLYPAAVTSASWETYTKELREACPAGRISEITRLGTEFDRDGDWESSFFDVCKEINDKCVAVTSPGDFNSHDQETLIAQHMRLSGKSQKHKPLELKSAVIVKRAFEETTRRILSM
ncbi:hypothetical protein PFISCL1PPCAC_4027, partial [Pristionchus fissidentatus]